jgi:hypothetical protein
MQDPNDNRRARNNRDQIKQLPPIQSSCAYCELPLDKGGPPVSLKSGHRVHIDCYFMLQRTPSAKPH